jgi:hypothetical protein
MFVFNSFRVLGFKTKLEIMPGWDYLADVE